MADGDRTPRILVVDDNEANRYAVGRMLRAAGLETFEASSGREALQKAKENPDVIVLDVNLPDVNGFDVVRELRSNPSTALIPILHLSASYMRDEDRVFGLDNGANAYLTHPIEPPVLLAMIRTLLRSRAIEEERAGLLASAERARADAEAANRAKSEFLATMSHEIRTPINAILGYAQILDMGLAGAVSREQRIQLDRLRRSATHLLALVNQLLDLGKVQSERMRLNVEPVLADEILAEALAIARPLALARNIKIDYDEPVPSGLQVTGDAGRIRQILVNLLSNAAKFSKAGSRVQLGGEVADSATVPPGLSGSRYVAFHIRDTGIGVSAEQLGSIFEPFVQGETGTTRTWGGTGLGLAVSRRLARLMDGDVTVASEGRAGSRFTLWLPAAEDRILAAITERRGVARTGVAFDSLVLAQLGRIVAGEALTISHAFAARIRTDDGFPPTGALSDGQLIDHLPSYIADLGLAMIIVGDVGIQASALLHDGNAIRIEIAERHGAQRRHLGWSTVQVECEYDILLAEIERVLRMRAGSGEQQLEGALELIGRLIEQSKVTSVRGYREAGGTED